NIQRVKVQRGTQVVVIGKPKVGADGTWLPIRPVPAEVRYIPADAVRPASAPAPASAPDAAAPAPPTAPVPALSASGYAPSRWTQALQAEIAGNTAEAVRLYDAASQEVAATNPSLAAECRARVQWLRDGARAATSANHQTERYAEGG